MFKTNDKLAVTALILSGGQGRRMGNKDKGLQFYRGKKLIEHMITRVRSQVDEIIISCNPANKQSFDDYAACGFELIVDHELNQSRNEKLKRQGPLAGIFSAAESIKTPLCFICPCDMPLIPTDLVEQLRDNLGSHQLVAARFASQTQPLLSLVRSETLKAQLSLRPQGSVFSWLKTMDTIEAEIQAEAIQFSNMNLLDDLED